MKAWYCSETPYPDLPPEDAYESVRVTIPNSLYDPEVGAQIYADRIAEWCAADEAGLNVMVNEHHQTATCIVPAVPVMASALAVRTKQARILVLGNPIANRREPVRVAEEMAMIDNMCHGRLEVGFVRGVPYEAAPANITPADTTDRLWEAHDLIMRCWEERNEPFSWEGRHFSYRQVNVWPRPYQQPHPPVWVTTTSTPNADRIGGYGYVAATFLIGHVQAKKIFDAYRERRSRDGLDTPNDRLAYCALVYTGATEAEGRAGAQELLWYLTSNKVPIQFRNPPGYVPIAANVQAVRTGRVGPRPVGTDLDELIEQGIVFAGTADQVAGQLERFYERVGGFGHLLMLGHTGNMSHADAVRGIEHFASGVYPRVGAFSASAGAAA